MNQKPSTNSTEPGDVLSFYFVAFLDVMGQSNKWERLTDLPKNDEEKAEAERIVGETVGFLRLFRKTFENFADGYLQQRKEALANKSEEAQKLSSQIETPFDFRFLSDSIIVSSPLAGNDEYCGAMIRIFVAFTGTIGAVVTSLARQQVIRGGLDVGLGVEVEPKEVYGSALVRAYKLESREADWPRVLIGDELWNFLQLVQSREPQTVLGGIARQFAALCLSLITTDQDDSRRILDYLAEPLATFQADSKEQFINGTLKPAYEFVRNQPEKWRSEGNHKLLDRSNRLLRYFESRVGIWNLSTVIESDQESR